MYIYMVMCIEGCVWLLDQIVNVLIIHVQSTPVISRQLGDKISERELSGSPVISRFRAKAQPRDLQDHSPTLWRMHPLNPNNIDY